MKENKFIKAEQDVLIILRKKINTRKSDQVLYLEYWKLKTKEKVPFLLFFLFPQMYNGCSFKTIERARRKVQSYFPELKEENITKKRMEEEMKYYQYSINK